MTDNLTSHQRRIIKRMRDENAHIVEERANEESHFYLRVGNITLANMTQRFVFALEEASAIQQMGVGEYDEDRQRWTQPAEVWDLPERASICQTQRDWLERKHNYEREVIEARRRGEEY